MILERLIELRNKLAEDDESGLIPSSLKEQAIRWVMDISSEGCFTGFISTGEKKKDYTVFSTPYKSRQGTAPNPFLLVDKLEFVIGNAEQTDTKVLARHEAYCQLMSQCLRETNEHRLTPYIMFLENEIEKQKARIEAQTKGIKNNDWIVPRVDGKIPSDFRSTQDFWAEYLDREDSQKSSLELSCMVCGQHKPIARIHPIEFSLGPDRPVLVTGDKSSFRSYGLQQSEIAPMCHHCVRHYGEALRWLLKSSSNSLRINAVTWVFWTREPTALNFATILSDPQPEQVKELLLGPQKGRKSSVDENRFYALSLSANKSRLIVRNWITATLSQVEENIAAYFARQGMCDRTGSSDPIKLISLATSLVRDVKDLPPQIVPTLLNHALLGSPLPLSMLQLAVSRARAERENVMTRPRAALIKMVLLSNSYSHEEIMPVLNPDHPSPAYHSGRLLALLDDVQRVAVGAKATLVDRYYGSASSTPATVFGALIRNAQNHLGKLRKTKPGLYIFFDRAIAEVTSHIQEFPKTLSLPDQGLFALGFYQQKHSRREKAPEVDEIEDDSSEQE